MKKILSLFLMLTLFMLPVSAVSIQPEEAFTDVSGEEYYAYAAAALKHHGVLSGYADGSFGAERSIARAEMAAIVCRMKLDDDSISRYQGQTLFRDVAGSHWASGYINYASNEGIVNGKGSGIFAPEAQVTLEEAVKMVVCALGWESQAQQQGGWPDGYYTVARNAGLLENVQGLKWQAATRGDIAVLVHAAMSQEVPMPAYQDYVIFNAQFFNNKNILLSAAEGCTIYYTVGGNPTDPTVHDQIYQRKFDRDWQVYYGTPVLKMGQTLKAIAVRDGLISGVTVIGYDNAVSSNKGRSGDLTGNTAVNASGGNTGTQTSGSGSTIGGLLTCPICHGSGQQVCFYCHGSGQGINAETGINGDVWEGRCPQCSGMGTVQCSTCAGTGKIPG